MAVEPIELGRLAIVERNPLHYVERRVESLDLPDDYHYRVEVTQQFTVPRHGESTRTDGGAERELLVPLGQFSKDSMPDLRAYGPDGANLPLLSRSDRGAVGATLFTTEWASEFYAGVPDDAIPRADEAWRTVWQLIAGAIAGSKREAEIKLDVLERALKSWSRSSKYPAAVQDASLAFLCREKFWVDLYALAETRLLVGRLRGVPKRTYTVTVRYTERFAYRGYAKTSVSHLTRKVLAWLGLISLPIARSVANVGQAASLWVVQSVPEGLEALRCYWKEERHSRAAVDPVSVEVTRAAAGRHAVPGEDSKEDFLLLDVQIAPSSALWATIGLAGLLLFVSTYVFQAIPTIEPAAGEGRAPSLVGMQHVLAKAPVDEAERVLLVGLGSIFAAVPAAVAGALAYRGQTFVRRVSRGPRVLLALLSVQAAFLAIVVSLKNLGDMTEVTAYILSLYSLAIIGIFGFIQLGPRWRRNEMSRRKSVTFSASPVECRKKQIRYAWLWLGFWTLCVGVFAQCQLVLQEDHFFTSEFPLNIWRAWWSLF